MTVRRKEAVGKLLKVLGSKLNTKSLYALYHAASMVQSLGEWYWLIILYKWKELLNMAAQVENALEVCSKCSTQSEYVVHDGDC